MALPSGYTQIDYIEATGTQYFDTGFKPNQNTRVVMDIEVLATTQCAPFGARASQNGTTYTLFLLTATTGRTDYGTSKQTMTFSSILGRYTIDANKNVVNVNGVSITHTAATFSVDYNMFLLAVNTAGAASNYAKVKLYSCKIYDNGTLARDFVPCKNTTGALGLWDNVNSKFYANAGTGTLSTGSKHKTLIDGTGYEIKSGRVLIGGTGYDIKKGRTLIDGTGYDIKFSTPVRELPVGSSVYMNVDGVRTEFLIVHQGKPDVTQNELHRLEYYDSTCVGTWVLMKDIYISDLAIRGDDDIEKYLSTTFFKKLDAQIQAMINPTNIPMDSDEDIYTDNAKVNKKTCKIFSLGAFEVGFYRQSGTNYVYIPLDGAKLDYFSKGASSGANNRRIARYSGDARSWALRAISYVGAYNRLWVINPSGEGTYNYTTAATFNEFRPAWIFTSAANAVVDDDFNVIPS